MKCVVTGRRHTVLGKGCGEVVYLDEPQASRLIRAGHVEPALEPPPPPPKRTRRRTPKPPPPTETEPRQDAGLSHVTDSAAVAEEEKE